MKIGSLSGYRDFRGQKLGVCITLANGLYSHVLSYCRRDMGYKVLYILTSTNSYCLDLFFIVIYNLLHLKQVSCWYTVKYFG